MTFSDDEQNAIAWFLRICSSVDWKDAFPVRTSIKTKEQIIETIAKEVLTDRQVYQDVKAGCT